ncbi:MAG: TonB-dependent receptor [Alphaproteobacteria bacterium]|nr:TonB-dependent receptor [Alphaproteobacteria bacterium]
MRTLRTLKALLLATGAVLVFPWEALAQDAAKTDVIIVTAQKRSEDIQDVPIAITALTGETLKDQHVTNVLDLNAMAPGLQVKTDDNAANPKIFIRGIGLNDFNPNTASAVAVYSDGVYIGSPLAQMGQFFDLERVEVLRGPQGTLYGRNTTGGAINLISRKPGDKFEADASVEYGSYNGVTVEGGVGGPVVPGVLAIRAAGVYVRNDGYTLNRLTGNRGNDTDRGSGRVTLDWTPSETFEGLFQVRYGRSNGGSIWAYNRSLFPATAQATGPDGLCAPAYYTSGECTDAAGYANTSTNLYQGDYHLEGKDKVETYGASGTLTWTLGGMSLVSVTGYDHADRDDLEDTDAGPNDVLTARYRAKQWAGSEELRLQSNGDNTLNWVAGLYYSHDDLSSNSYYDVFRLANSGVQAVDEPQGIGVFSWPFTQKTDSYAAFGQVDYKVTERLTATLGLRYSVDSKDFHYNSLYASDVGGPTLDTILTDDASKNFSSLSGKVSVAYKLTDYANVYASYNRGYKSGGFFGGQTTDASSLKPYDDEVVNAYEVGAKTELLGRLLTANVSAFYYDYQNLQVYTLVVDPNTNLTVQNFTNASNAKVQGLEAELSSSPIDGLDLSLSTSFLEATYRNFTSAGTDYSGNHLPNAPRATINGSARYHWALFGGTADTQASVSYRSKVYYDTTNADRLTDQERTFVDLRAGWKMPDGRIEFGLWGRNVFGETNISDIIPIEGLGFDLFSMGPRQTAGVYARFNY